MVPIWLLFLQLLFSGKKEELKRVCLLKLTAHKQQHLYIYIYIFDCVRVFLLMLFLCLRVSLCAQPTLKRVFCYATKSHHHHNSITASHHELFIINRMNCNTHTQKKKKKKYQRLFDCRRFVCLFFFSPIIDSLETILEVSMMKKSRKTKEHLQKNINSSLTVSCHNKQNYVIRFLSTFILKFFFSLET